MEKSDAKLEQYVDIRFLEPEECSFELKQGGFLSLGLKSGEKYPRVNLYKAFPFTSADEYISVRDNDGKEIGIIRSIHDFPGTVIKYIETEIERRYFAPSIKELVSVKEEFGYSYWEVVTDAGPCRFTVKGGTQNIIHVDNQRIMIIDVDGTRYDIPDVNKLDEKSMKKIETFL